MAGNEVGKAGSSGWPGIAEVTAKVGSVMTAAEQTVVAAFRLLELEV